MKSPETSRYAPLITADGEPDWGEIRDQYQTSVQTQAEFADTKNMVTEAGRGTGKSTRINAKRLVRMSWDMKRSTILLGGPTYVFVLQTILPALLNYIAQVYIRGVHYEIGKEPPKHFLRPYEEILSWKHTISFAWGTVIQFVSADRPDSAIGKNAAAVDIDEVLRIPEIEFRERIVPALRSDRSLFGHSHYYGGITLTSSTPNMENDYDWWLDYEAEMKKSKVDEVMYVNYRIMRSMGENIFMHRDIHDLEQKRPAGWIKKRENLQKKIAKNNRFVARWDAKRVSKLKEKDYWWYYLKASSFSNLAHLGLDYMLQQLSSSRSNIDKFKLSILGIRPDSVKEKFFSRFSVNTHIFRDSYKYKFSDGYRGGDIDEFSIEMPFMKTSSDLKYCDTMRPLYAGYDPGNFSSIQFAQEYRSSGITELRVIKNFWAYIPEEHYELAAKIDKFFAHHIKKVIYLHYDRAGNKRLERYKNNPKGKTDATILARCLEDLGWTVHLESLKQRTIFLWEHFMLWSKLLAERETSTPRIRICNNECEETISSIQHSPRKRSEDSFIDMDKSSERKLDYEDQVMFSTQLATALMYLVWGLYSELKPEADSDNYNIEGL